MFDQKRDLFQSDSLQRLSSPEKLDQLLRVVKPQSWLSLLSVGMVIGVATIWSIYGRIPVTVEGKGILIYPRQVVPLQSTSAGQVLSLNVKVGDVVKKGQLLATLDQTELQKQLQQQRSKLAEIEAQDSAASSLQGKGSLQEIKTIHLQRQNNLQRIQELQALTPILREKSLASIQKQREQIQQRIAELQEIAPILKQKSLESLQKQGQSLNQQIQVAKDQLPILQKSLDNRRLLREEGVVNEDVLFQAQKDYANKVQEISHLEVQLKELALQESEAEERYTNNLNEIARNRADLQRLAVEETNAQDLYLKNISDIAQLQTQLKDFDRQEANLEKQNLQDTNTRKREIQEVKREITKLELQLRNNSQIISQQNGRILEITIAPGQVINIGTRFGSLDEEKSSSLLVGITYLSIADGKKIQPGMKLQITPQTVKRERFGGIVGTVTSISPFPVTKEAAISVVGNPEVVEGLASQKPDGMIQIFADLVPDSATTSGYQWSSSHGPAMKISPGTTTVVRIKVEERAPITYVFPILRSISGIY